MGAGGFLGALARYGLSGVVHRFYGGPFPLDTLVVNVLGCLFVGALMAMVEERQHFSPEARLFLMIGLLGSFTTFSTLSYETLELLRDSSYRLALWNLAGSAVLGLVAVAMGRALVR